jgi:hypothetical protein
LGGGVGDNVGVLVFSGGDLVQVGVNFPSFVGIGVGEAVMFGVGGVSVGLWVGVGLVGAVMVGVEVLSKSPGGAGVGVGSCVGVVDGFPANPVPFPRFI